MNMVLTLTTFVVGMSPILFIIVLLALAAWRDHAYEAVVARQIRLTDAIAAELGAIVAPVVKKRPWGPWQIEMAVPLGRPAVVERVLSITHRVLPGRYELRLTPSEAAPATDPSRIHARPSTAGGVRRFPCLATSRRSAE